MISKWFVWMLISVTVQGKMYFVSDFGAHPDDDFDDTNPIQLAINCAISSGLVSDIIFDEGVYTMSSSISIYNATSLTIIGQGIDKTLLIGSTRASIFSIHASQQIKLKSFSIDYQLLPFTGGYVVNVNDKYLDIQIVPPHQTDVNQQVPHMIRYDPQHMRPAFGPNAYETFQNPPEDANTSIISPGVLRVPLSLPTKFVKGDAVISRFGCGDHALYGIDVIDMSIQFITIYTSWCMGFVTLRATRLNITNFYVIPRTGRWLSSSIDCMHFVDAREYVFISDSLCQGMTDDGLNVHAVYFNVSQVINSTSIMIEALKGDDPLDFGVGTHLEFSSNQQPFTVYGNGTVNSIEFHSPNTRIITFNEIVNISVNDKVCVSDTPFLIIRNLTVSHNRARGVLLETRNVDIRRSIFNRTSGPAILIQPSLFWYEGPEARNISLIENLYIDNNEGLAYGKGVITILPDPMQLIPVIKNIRIESSTFYFGTYSQGLLQCDNVNNLFITNNYMFTSTNLSTPFVSICNSRNISAVNNCLVCNQTKRNDYYEFDPAQPCSMNFSSLIDLTAAGFNSSFPPPVFIDENQHSNKMIMQSF